MPMTHMNFAGRKIAVDIPHFAFATGIAGWAAWYCWDAWHANAAVENMILILPVSAIAIVLYFFVVAGSLQTRRSGGGASRSSHAACTPAKLRSRLRDPWHCLRASFLPRRLIGFDVASFAYMLLMMVFPR